MTGLNNSRFASQGARVRAWMVPPLMLPLALGLMIAAYALIRALV